MQYLNLEGNTLGVDAAKAIAKCLESHSELKHALWKDLFTGRMKTEIPKALVSLMFEMFLCHLIITKMLLLLVVYNIFFHIFSRPWNLPFEM